jgi:hypothetical protein
MNETTTQAVKAPTLKGFLIDCHTRTITEVAVPNSRALRDESRAILDYMYRTLDVDLVTTVTLNSNSDTLWLDDEGLLKKGAVLWHYKGSQQYFAGRGLVLGSDDEGYSTSVSDAVTLDTLRESITWTEHRLR